MDDLSGILKSDSSISSPNFLKMFSSPPMKDLDLQSPSKSEMFFKSSKSPERSPDKVRINRV